MSLDVMLNGAVGDELYSANITHNSRVWPMLRASTCTCGGRRNWGSRWRLNSSSRCEEGLARLKPSPKNRGAQRAERLGQVRAFRPVRPNYLRACENSPTATVSVSR